MADNLTTPIGWRLNRISPVVPAGLATTALTLLGNWWLAGAGFDVMGLYGWLIVPVGAMLVGALAASGYLLAAWLRGEKISGLLLASVCVLQCLAYVQAQYSDYKHVDPRFEDGTPVGFPAYFDATTRSITLRSQHARQPGPPLGAWGYGIRLLELFGFTGGALIALGLLRSSDYCESCQRYMRRRLVVTLPAAVAHRKLRHADIAGRESYEAAQAEAEKKCDELLASILSWADANHAEPLRKIVAELRPSRRRLSKLPMRVHLFLTRCPRCAAGFLAADLGTGQGTGTRLKTLWKHKVEPTFVRDLLADESK